MLDRVTVNSDSLRTMLLRLHHLGAHASTDAPNADVMQGNVTSAFEDWDYLVVDKLKTESGREYRLYSTLTLRKYLSGRQIELLKTQIKAGKQEIENTNAKKSIFTSTITTTPELERLENALKQEEGICENLQDDPQNDGIYMIWNKGEFEDWYDPNEGRSMYQFLVGKDRLKQRQEEEGVRREQRQRPSNYLVIHKVMKEIFDHLTDHDPTFIVDKLLRRYETPESYEWWSKKGEMLEECPVETGQSYFNIIQNQPQLLYYTRGPQGTSEYWSYADALKWRQARLDAAEKDRRLHLPEQAAFLQEYKEKYPNP